MADARSLEAVLYMVGVGIGKRKELGWHWSHSSTKIIAVVSDQMAVNEPSVDSGVIGNETWYGASHKGAIATDHVLHVDISLVQLVYH